MERDGNIEVGMGFMAWELKETAPLKNKWRKYTLAEPQPVPTAHVSFTSPDNSGEELDLEPLEGLDTSFNSLTTRLRLGTKGTPLVLESRREARVLRKQR